MRHPIGKIRYIAITLGLFLVITSNILNWQDQIIGLIFGSIYFLFYGYITGSIIATKKFWRLLLGTALLLSIIASTGAILLYLASLNQVTILGLTLFFPAILFLPYYRHRDFEHRSLKQIFAEYKEKVNQRNESWINWIILITYSVIWIVAGLLIFMARSNESLQSPWQVISWKFFPLYLLASILLLIYCIKTTRHAIALILINAHSLLSLSIAVVVYAVGFGFDPFIHEAAQKIILETGNITPVTPYYLGQYSIVVFLHHLTLIDIGLINKFIVPIFFSLVIPSTIFYVFSQWLKKNDALIISLAILTLPFGNFIMSTPQNLANVFFIFTVLMSMLYFKNQFSAVGLFLLTLGCMAIHPLAGIPLGIFVIICVLFKKLYSVYKKTPIQFFLLSLIFIWVMPLVFLASQVATNLQLPTINFKQIILDKKIDQYDLFLNITYFIQSYYLVIFGAIFLAGIIYITKNKLIKNSTAHLAASLVLLINFLIVKYFLNFENLQLHDQTEFVNRLAWLTIYASLPTFFIGFYIIYKKWQEKNNFTAFAIILLIATAMTISVYLSYPRVDTYQPSKLFSVSQYDIEAVRLIDQRADVKHVVLANQMVGVTAISQLGFKQYYENEFYYSMPMGPTQTLYQAYLDMIYQGSTRETMQTVIDKFQVNEAYFVLNSYWNNSEKIIAQAKQSADAFYNINNKVYIFKYVAD